MLIDVCKNKIIVNCGGGQEVEIGGQDGYEL